LSRAPRFTVGLIGSSIEGSLSPALHEREAEELGLHCVYRLIDIDVLGLGADAVGDLVAQAEREGFAGVNITHPCKQEALRVLDELSAEARALQAVNTVVFRDGRRIGHNTDWSGFAEGVRRGLPSASLNRVVLVGAGGAGSAVAYALLGLGARTLDVVDVDPERAARLAAAVGGDNGTVVPGTIGQLEHLLARADGLVNASPVGMTPELGIPVSPSLLRSDLWVADVVYRPLDTELLREARARGCRTVNGGDMLVFQAAAAFRLFTDVSPDPDRMYRHFLDLTRARIPRPKGGDIDAQVDRDSIAKRDS
jgi:quinate/shikimate dehydrogenase (NAD+)